MCLSVKSCTTDTHVHILGRADMVCHWEDSDVVAQEMYSNVSHLVFLYEQLLILWIGQDTLICICIALAVS